jgi:dTDP-4-dehydrorhamnose 3,5-epimerase
MGDLFVVPPGENAYMEPSRAIAGVSLRRLTAHRDPRGYVAEVFRTDWETRFSPVQWHVLNCRAGSLRGVHLHLAHTDWKLVISGRQLLALVDLRLGSPTEGATDLVELSADEPKVLLVPPGVAHGVYALDDSVTLVGVDRPYDGDDDFACLWSDPALGIGWPPAPAHLSDRDRTAPTLEELRRRLGERLRIEPAPL